MLMRYSCPFHTLTREISQFYVTFLTFLYFAGKNFPSSNRLMAVLCFAGTDFCYQTLLHEFFGTHALTQLFSNTFSTFPEFFNKIALEIH